MSKTVIRPRSCRAAMAENLTINEMITGSVLAREYEIELN